MKTRYLTLLFVTAAGASFGLGACNTGSAPIDDDVEVRVRNTLPAACTAADIARCPAVQVKDCPAGQVVVGDYVADCCLRVTCQPICSTSQKTTCDRTPAPDCPRGTQLWIGTAIEDCCPAYRCEPDGSTCDPSKEVCGCNATNVACALAQPYCGEGIQPIIVGQTDACCPVYQCPCPRPVDPATGGAAPPTPPDLSYCGCTRPSCERGEYVACEGLDFCGGPCTCKPAVGGCKDDSTCRPDQQCDLSACRLPPRPADATAAVCDPVKCGPKPELPNRVCVDGTVGGVTDRCLQAADGSCRWEVRDCPTDCYGTCVPRAPTTGCSADSDCGDGQVCNLTCEEWSCAPAAGGPGTTDPSTGAPAIAPCARCDADSSCSCDATTGACKGRKCAGQCAPKPTTCDPARTICPAIAIVCPDGQTPTRTDRVNPNTCCPDVVCPPPVCDRTTGTSTTGATTNACPAIRCACGSKFVATDPATCCPKYECIPARADGTCA